MSSALSILVPTKQCILHVRGAANAHQLMISAYKPKKHHDLQERSLWQRPRVQWQCIQLFESVKANTHHKVTTKHGAFLYAHSEAVSGLAQVRWLREMTFFDLKGNQVIIFEFAKSLISFQVLTCKMLIEIIGNRGNEKLSEELWSEQEIPQNTINPWILKVECPIDGGVIEQYMQSSKLFTREICQLPSDQIKTEIYQFLKAIDS